jgi:hypothetical protein
VDTITEGQARCPHLPGKPVEDRRQFVGPQSACHTSMGLVVFMLFSGAWGGF